MLVKQILAQKSLRGIETIAPHAYLSEAATRLAHGRIGALIVSRDGARVDGILSERDIVRELGSRGADCLRERVDAVMTRKVACCSTADAAETVLTQMTDGRFRHMPVVEGGRMVGVVSIGDVVKARMSQIETEKHALEDMIRGF
ncbi:MAG: CBS domain-containing protein [Pseudomonadota bacterium]